MLALFFLLENIRVGGIQKINPRKSFSLNGQSQRTIVLFRQNQIKKKYIYLYILPTYHITIYKILLCGITFITRGF